ncbi:hypothetical protein ACFQ1A_29195, partial [Massilia pinisoli]|uniref:hypothetical protein n=1 Tax=Massilia pinisoli TaxID=1772194 RepID=UPI00363D3035
DFFSMKETRSFLGIAITTLLHSYCCIFPLFISVWGSVSMLGKLLVLQPFFWIIQAGVLGFTLYGYYFKNPNPTKKQRLRIMLVWGLLLYSLGIFIIPHTDWIKSDIEKLKIEQTKRILQSKTSKSD